MILDFRGYLAERAATFTGREWVLDAFAAWRDDAGGERYFLITGEPGAGKTAVAARIAREDGLVDAVHFCSALERHWTNPRTFAESISGQLAARSPAFAAGLRSWAAPSVTIEQRVSGDNLGQVIGVETLVVDSSAEDVFERLVRAPLDTVGQPLLLLVDALDESLAYSGPVTIADLVLQGERLPPNVRFVLTSRPQPELLRTLRRAGVRECALAPRVGPGHDLALRDVERFVLRESEGLELDSGLSAQRFAAAVRDRSEGNFLFARHLLYTLEHQPGPITASAVAGLPRSLDGVYLDFLQGLAGRGRRPYAEVAPVLTVLAVAQEPFEEDRIARFAGLPAVTVRGVLADLRQFLSTDDTRPASTRTYALYHASFGELLRDRDRAEEYWVDGRAAHRAIADTYTNGDLDEYGLNSLAAHLYEAGETARLQQLLDAGWFAERRASRNGGYDGVLADLDLAWRAAERADREAAAAGRPAPHLADELRWAVVTASIGTLTLPTELLRDLAVSGVWTAVQVLGYARLNRSAPDRAIALAALAPVLPEVLREDAYNDAVDVAAGLPGEGREPAAARRVTLLARLAPLLPPGPRRRALLAALHNARRLSDLRRVAEGNVGHYGSGPGQLYRHTGLRATALQQLHLTEPPDDDSDAQAAWLAAWLAEPGPALEFAAPDRAEVTRRLAEVADRPVGGAVPDLGPPPARPSRHDDPVSRLNELIGMAPKPGTPRSHAAMITPILLHRLVEIAPQLPRHALPTAMALAERIAEPHARKHALRVLAQAAQEQPWDDPVVRLDELIRRAPSTYGVRDDAAMAAPYQAAVLAEIAAELPRDALPKALDLAERIIEPYARDRALQALAPVLGEPELRGIIGRIAYGRGVTHLAPIVAILPEPLLLEALAAVRKFDGRFAELGLLANYLPGPRADAAIIELSTWLDGVDLASDAGRNAVANVAGTLPSALASRAFAALRHSIMPAESWGTPRRDFTTTILQLAPRLPEPDRTEALDLVHAAAVRSTWGTTSWGSIDAQAPLHGALELAGALPPSPQRDRLLRTLTEQALAQARSANYGRGYSTWMLRYRIGLLIILLPHLAEPHRTDIAREVLRMIAEESAVPLPDDQCATLAAHLPAAVLPDAERTPTAGPLPLFLPRAMLPAALDLARRNGNIDWLLAVYDRGLPAECLDAADELGGPLLRADLINRHPVRLAALPAPQLHAIWAATLRGFATLDRPAFLGRLRGLSPTATALGGGPNVLAELTTAVEAVIALWP